ncbi:energy-coupling factor ABC transporter ATP-binding protein [Sediminibacillus albus]|uniref:Energy-coupling factor transport system ATP-binding protein n=1 Tax=Sediminibacillus albus TaxID=407036 RepID=A0A1G9D0J3_9BACI|nr:energy-coupling factor ABC transporter ATP-binding protein [Sediminibacillus albus]SDK57458.1 energy-coupling factor transport system ATP-binding protein [Sediminibacillus albus]
MGYNFIEFKNVSFRYGENMPWVLENVSFQIKSDEWIAIIGHNGSGKSTIAKLMNGLLSPQKGTILIDGMEVNEDTIWEIRKKIGMVFQNPDNQFVGTTVQDDVAFGMENRGVPRQEMLKRLEDSLSAVGMQDYELREPHRLSGGQKQRVAIAGVLAISPQAIILDEATAMLDPNGRKEIMDTIRSVKKKHPLSLITITHDLNEVTLVDRVIVMNKGKVWLEASPRQVFSRKKELLEIGLDIPFIAKLAGHLSQQGMPLKNEPLSHEELLEELWTYHSKM